MDALPAHATPPRDRRILVILLVFGIMLRLFLAVGTGGTNDLVHHATYAQIFNRGSLEELYGSRETFFNFPPLMAYLFWGMAETSGFLGVSFAVLYRVFGVVCETVTLYALWLLSNILRATEIDSPFMMRCRDRGGILGNPVLAYALALPAIVTSGFHGNMEPLVLTLLACALLLVAKEKVFLAAVCYGAACNVKVIPLLVLPLFLVAAHRVHKVRDFLLGFFLTLLPFVWGAYTGGDLFFERVFLYTSQPDLWGIRMLATLLPFSDTDEFVTLLGKVCIYGSALAVAGAAFVGRFRSYPIALSAVFTSFLIFAPGFGPQYLVYPLPFFALAAPRVCLVLSGTLGVYQLAYYLPFLKSSAAWLVWVPGTSPQWVAEIGLIAWCSLLLALVSCLGRQDSEFMMTKG